MLLPKLQGAAGKYVFKVLTLYNQIRLQEVGKRAGCKVPEGGVKMQYHRQLNGISQMHGESEQELAAEIKRLNDKAYPSV